MRFNTKSVVRSKTVNRAGGEAFKQSTELELVSLLLASFVSDKHYESKEGQLTRLENLVSGLKDKKFAAKAAIFARTEIGMRSITHALFAELVKVVKGEEWLKNAISKGVYRVDDMTEILAAYASKYGKPIPNSLKKGLALAINKFDEYQLAKYKGNNRDVKLVDLLNLVHPKPARGKAKLFKSLVKGNLASKDTWESKLSEAGKVEAETEEEKVELVAENKRQAWTDMLESGKLGYFALLRNVRNILEQAPELVDLVAQKIQDRIAIKKSLILPFQFKKAYDAVAQVSFDGTRKMLVALDKAVDYSVDNCPEFPGKTLVVLDSSGSMGGQPAEIGALFLAAIAKKNKDCDTMLFSDDARYMSINPNSLISDIVKSIPFISGGTDFHSIFQTANKAYDRIIILSDMQGWVGHTSPVATFNAYKEKYGCSPKIYSFDLAGHGDMQFPENNVFCIAGFSDKILELMKWLEQDRNVLINRINAIEL